MARGGASGIPRFDSLGTLRGILAITLLLYSAAVVAVLVLVLSGTASSIAGGIRGNQADIAARPAPSMDTVAVEIAGGSSAEVIAQLLHEEGIVRDAEGLRVLMVLTNAAPQLQAGRYEFALRLPPGEVLHRLLLGPDLIELITFREGLRVEEIGILLEREEIASEAEWQAALAAAPLPRHQALFDGRPEGADLTGYLLPASYEIERDTTALDLLHMMLDAFLEQVTDELIEEAQAQGMSLHQVLTLASIVEREAVHPEERPLVASVFRNRLDVGMALQADPTVQYAVSVDPVEGDANVAEYGYWKRGLTIWDLEIDSPYNTYLYPGLPPGPIANPGIDSIRASVLPADTEYFYFVAHPDCDGRHLFATTLEEHNVNVAAFRASGCGEED